jgi:hypothetical protein
MGGLLPEVVMRLRIAAFTFLLAATAMLPAGAQAQRSYLQKPTIVSVQYMVRLPLKTDDIAEQQRVMEDGRKQLYEIGARECGAILATLASSCTLQSLNVQTNLYRQRNEDNAITLTANAQYQIELKGGGAPADGER